MRIHRVGGLLLIAAAGLAAASTGCKDTVTGPLVATRTPTPAPTPTPLPGNIAGDWAGTESGQAAGCPTVDASATFQQSGQNVTGTLNAPNSICGFTDLQFTGTIVGSTVSGTADGGLIGHGTVTGTLSGSNLTLQIRDLDLDTAEVDMDLHR